MGSEPCIDELTQIFASHLTSTPFCNPEATLSVICEAVETPAKCLSSISFQNAKSQSGGAVFAKVIEFMFRRTYTTLLHANGEDVKVVQELLRHGSSQITMDVYAQAVTPAKRKAQGKVVAMLRDTKKTG